MVEKTTIGEIVFSGKMSGRKSARDRNLFFFIKAAKIRFIETLLIPHK